MAVICSVEPKSTFVFGDVTVIEKFVGAAGELLPHAATDTSSKPTQANLTIRIR
jgi:hypothetical protein